jgi:hypothetical protein
MTLGKLNKAEQKEFDALRDEASRALDAYKAFVDKERDVEDRAAIDALVEESTPLAEAMEAAFVALVEFATAFADAQQESWDEKSERWQDGDRGQAVSSWIDEWRNFDEVSMPEISDSMIEDEFPQQIRLSDLIDLYEYENVLDTANGVSFEAEE